ncbi:hypothetical protein [Paucisalibacillus globulus]|uniref:hypothetical protein n=1 Tax=Paucisalibacillus globulus TaxID=351095 RepID=UPI00041BB9BA|nr:hypothetical protein [Paucisalibacillus globulus]
MKVYIRNAIVAALIVALITGLFSYLFRGYFYWGDTLNAAAGTFIIWAFLFPLVYKYTGYCGKEE